jgi:DNA replication and repair protein RecF
LYGAAAPQFTKLSLWGFRNYQAASLVAERQVMVLVGENGTGKTNILEALSLFAPGRGLRQARLAQMIYRAPHIAFADLNLQTTAGKLQRAEPVVRKADSFQEFFLQAALAGPYGVLNLQTHYKGPQTSPAQSSLDGGGAVPQPAKPLLPTMGERRRIFIEDKPMKGGAALAPYVSLLWLTPSFDRLLVESVIERRRFLDRLVQGIDSGHGGRLAAYEQALRERWRLMNGALVRGREDMSADPAWLSAIERQMAEQGVAVAAARLDLVRRLRHMPHKTLLGPFPTWQIKIHGWVEEALERQAAVEVETAFAQALEARRKSDLQRGQTSLGVHKTDFSLWHQDKAMEGANCSTGEQKALIMALFLSAVAVIGTVQGMMPVVLLDEVVAHFDARHRQHLFALLPTLKSQIWLTGTSKEDFVALKDLAQFLTIPFDLNYPQPSS